MLHSNSSRSSIVCSPRFTCSWHQWTQRAKTAVWFVFLVDLCNPDAALLLYCEDFPPTLVLFWIAPFLSQLFSFSSGTICSTSLDKLSWKYGTMRLVSLVMDYTRAFVYCYTLSGFGLHPFVSFGDVIKGFVWVMERIYPLKARSTLNLVKDWTLGTADWTRGQCGLCRLEWWSRGGEAERKLTTRAEHSVTR